VQGIDNPIFVPFTSKDSMSDIFKFDEAQSQNRAMLRLVYVLEKGKRIRQDRWVSMNLYSSSFIQDYQVKCLPDQPLTGP
jgi:hypothetical protein